MVTFVQATYALVTFVQISNISAVTGPILKKLFNPIFLGHNFCGPKCSWTKLFQGPKIFSPEISLVPKKFLDQNFSDPNFFRTQIFFLHIFFSGPNFVSTKNFSGPKIFWTPNFFWTPSVFRLKIFLSQNFFWPQNFFQT